MKISVDKGTNIRDAVQNAFDNEVKLNIMGGSGFGSMHMGSSEVKQVVDDLLSEINKDSDAERVVGLCRSKYGMLPMVIAHILKEENENELADELINSGALEGNYSDAREDFVRYAKKYY